MQTLFIEGRRYKVKKTIKYLNHVLNEGDVVVFEKSTYDPRFELTRYWLRNEPTGETNAWHVMDDGPTAAQLWSTLFEAVET